MLIKSHFLKICVWIKCRCDLAGFHLGGLSQSRIRKSNWQRWCPVNTDNYKRCLNIMFRNGIYPSTLTTPNNAVSEDMSVYPEI